MIVHTSEKVSKSQMSLRNIESNLIKATMTPLNIVGLSKYGLPDVQKLNLPSSPKKYV